MHFLIIQGLKGKLQAHKERINKTQEDVVPNTFSKQDGSIYIPKG